MPLLPCLASLFHSDAKHNTRVTQLFKNRVPTSQEYKDQFRKTINVYCERHVKRVDVSKTEMSSMLKQLVRGLKL